MNLTFAEDFTSSISLDGQLLGVPDSGYYWNRGVHPSVNVDNLLAYLPNVTITFAAWSAETTYGQFLTTRKRTDIVIVENELYQSIAANNVNHNPKEENSTYWLKTDIDSLRIKSFIFGVEDSVLNALDIEHKLIENQYIYGVGETDYDLPDDYSGWVFEPKGSDYVKIRINQIAIQANTTDPINLYVINQGRLINTISLTPNNGIFEFQDVELEINLKGVTILAIDSQSVKTNNEGVYPYSYKGFTCYTVSGKGSTPQSAEYSINGVANGLSFNVSAYLDSSQYITNNKKDLGYMYQAQFEYSFIRHMVNNANNRFNMKQRIQEDAISRDMLASESLDARLYTVANKYRKQLAKATDAINSTFDRFLTKKKGLRIKRKVI